MQSLTIQSYFDNFNKFFLIPDFSVQQKNKMSEKKCEKVNTKSNKTPIKTKNDANILSNEHLQNETLLKDFKKKNIKNKKQLDFLETKSKNRKKFLIEKKLRKIDPERKKVNSTLTKKHCQKKKKIKHASNQSLDTLTSTNNADEIPKLNIRQMEIESLNNLITNVNQEQQNKNINCLPTCK